MRRTTSWSALALVSLSAAPAAAQLPDAIAFVGAEIRPVSGAVIARGTIVVKGGRITQIGADVPIPGDARVIDCAGRVITPGLIESVSQLGLVEISMVSGTVDHGLAWPDPVRAALRVGDAVDPRSTLIGVARRHGVTSAVAAPTGGLISGQASWLDLVGPEDPDARSPIEDPVAMFGNLGEAGAASVGGNRAGAWMRLREVFEDARVFQRDQAGYRRNALRPLVTSRLDLEALQPVLARRLPMVLHVERAADILAALRWASEEKVQIVLAGAGEGWLVADAIAKARVPVIVDPLANLPTSFESRHARADNAMLLARAGVPVALSSFSSHNASSLRFVAGNAVRAGLPADAALRAVTLVPATLYGMDKKLGSLERGRVANLVVWTGDPFEPSSHAERVVIRGRVQPTENRQTRLRDRHLRRLGLGG